MSKLSKAQKSIKQEISIYHKKFKASLESNIRILDFISDFVHYQKSDPIVPTLTFLSKKLFGEIDEDMYTSVILLDLLYTATLIHEDVTENYQQKQKLNPIQKLWQGKLSVLMGDFFLAKGLLNSVQEKSYPLLETVSETVKQITEGKLYNTYYHRSIPITKEQYFELIDKKFPTLFQTCTQVAALSAGIPNEMLQSLKSFGYNLGIIKQFDEEIKSFTLKNKKTDSLSFMVVWALDKSTIEEQQQIKKLLNAQDKKSLNLLKNIVLSKGVMEDIISLRNEFIRKAEMDIKTFPDSKNRQELLNLITIL